MDFITEHITLETVVTELRRMNERLAADDARLVDLLASVDDLCSRIDMQLTDELAAMAEEWEAREGQR